MNQQWKSQRPPSPTVYRLVAQRMLTEVPNHVKDFPQDCIWRDRYGTTALHLLSQHVGWDYAHLRTPLSTKTTTTSPTSTVTSTSTNPTTSITPTTTCRQQQQSMAGEERIATELLRAVEAILEHVPAEMVGTPNASSLTPMHLACLGKGRDVRQQVHSSALVSLPSSWEGTVREAVVLKFVRIYRKAISMEMQSVSRKTPFHIACERNASYRVLHAMLEADPTLMMTPENVSVNVSMNLLWNSSPSSTLSSMLSSMSAGTNHLTTDARTNDFDSDCQTTTNSDTTVDEIDRKMALLAHVAAHGTVQGFHWTNPHNNQSFAREQLSTACSVKCPRGYISLLLCKYCSANDTSTVFCDVDAYGMVPLHYVVHHAQVACQTNTEFLIQSVLEIFPKAASCPFPKNYDWTATTKCPLFQLSDCRFVNTSSQNCSNSNYNDNDGHNNDGINTLDKNDSIRSQANDAQQKEQQDRILPLLPLHVLVMDRAMTWDVGGVRSMVHAYPDALRTVDARNGLAPFMTSAIHATKSRLHLTTTYELLLAAPEMIQATATLAPKSKQKEISTTTNRTNELL